MILEDMLDDKHQSLIRMLHDMGSVVVAYSGGVDSTLLAYLANLELGKRAISVTAVSPSLAPEELEEAKQIANQFNFSHTLLESHEVEDPRYQENTPIRCYWCKTQVYGLLNEFAAQHGISAVIDGTNYDDLGDMRPGRKAAKEHGVISPLLEAEMTKEEVRFLARQYGLPNWDKAAAACLSSRIPYGTFVNPELLSKVAQAELILKRLEIHGSRVRHHGEIARIEVHEEDISKVIHHRENIFAEIQNIGYTFVTLDLAGYQTGSLNRLLKAEDGE